MQVGGTPDPAIAAQAAGLSAAKLIWETTASVDRQERERSLYLASNEILSDNFRKEQQFIAEIQILLRESSLEVCAR
jgi:hypothetical protein